MGLNLSNKTFIPTQFLNWCGFEHCATLSTNNSSSGGLQEGFKKIEMEVLYSSWLFIVFLFTAKGSHQVVVEYNGHIGGEDTRALISPSTARSSPFSAVALVTCDLCHTQSCSGTLIGPFHVLTAASCLDTNFENMFKYFPEMVSAKFLGESGNLENYVVERVFIPEHWLKEKFFFDYAVLRLKESPQNHQPLSVGSWVGTTRGIQVDFSGFPEDGKKPKDSMWTSHCRLGSYYSKSNLNNDGSKPRKHEIPLNRECDADRGTVGAGIVASRDRKMVIGLFTGMKILTVPLPRGGSLYHINMATLFTEHDVAQIGDWMDGRQTIIE